MQHELSSVKTGTREKQHKKIAKVTRQSALAVPPAVLGSFVRFNSTPQLPQDKQ